jgi:hypothetical protein
MNEEMRRLLLTLRGYIALNSGQPLPLSGQYMLDRIDAVLAPDSQEPQEPDSEYDDDGMTDAEADADVLRMAGMGTDEDYGVFHDGDMDSHMAFDHVERDHDEPFMGDE